MQPDSAPQQGERVRLSWGAAGGIWTALVVWSVLRVPVPAVNEPHYLGKARHYWDPNWCPGDFFFDSANPHLIFYVTFGWLTQLVSLDAAASVGRCIGLGAVALGWQKLSQTLSGTRWAGMIALPFYLLLQALGNWSGEWLVGGIEAKVPAYGFLFWAIGAWLAGELAVSGVAAGLSVSFHPLIGLWGVIAMFLASVAISCTERFFPLRTSASAKEIAIAGILFVLTALPGLLPALRTLRSEDAKTDRIATQLQVGDRLAHHLDPMRFPKSAYAQFGLLIFIWILLQRRLPVTSERSAWQAFVGATLLIAGVGVVVGWGPRPVTQMPGHDFRLWLLKFYPFRLADLIVPVAVSLAVADCWLHREELRTGQGRAKFAAVLLAGVFGAVTIPFVDQNPSRLSPLEREDWIHACAWLKEQAQPADVVYATDSGWAVKWFAQRPEYVNYKDVPQDSESLLEWNDRLWKIANWRIAVTRDGKVTPEELADLRRQTGIGYLICGRFGPVNAQPVYENRSFRVYALPAE